MERIPKTGEFRHVDLAAGQPPGQNLPGRLLAAVTRFHPGRELPCRIIMRPIIAMPATMATAMIATTGQPHPEPQKP